VPDRIEDPAGNGCLVVGLGNPGAEYRFSRHNVGFMVLDNLARDLDLVFETYGRLGLICGRALEMPGFSLLKPITFMNLSGRAVGDVKDRQDVPLDRVFVVSDDINLPVGRIRIRRKGSDGGHKGLKSIIRTLGCGGFPRLRIGVGPVSDGIDAADYVLDSFTRKEFDNMRHVLPRAVEALRLWLDTCDIDLCMNRFNRGSAGC